MSTTTNTETANMFTYEHWRHGGWYVNEVRYPGGGVGCVSRNYSDKKWRIVDENTGPGSEGDRTFPNRDAAARAELDLAKAQWDQVRNHINYPLYKQMTEALPEDLLRRVQSFAHVDVVLRVAANDTGRERR